MIFLFPSGKNCEKRTFVLKQGCAEHADFSLVGVESEELDEPTLCFQRRTSSVDTFLELHRRVAVMLFVKLSSVMSAALVSGLPCADAAPSLRTGQGGGGGGGKEGRKVGAGGRGRLPCQPPSDYGPSGVGESVDGCTKTRRLFYLTVLTHLKQKNTRHVLKNKKKKKQKTKIGTSYTFPLPIFYCDN